MTPFHPLSIATGCITSSSGSIRPAFAQPSWPLEDPHMPDAVRDFSFTTQLLLKEFLAPVGLPWDLKPHWTYWKTLSRQDVHLLNEIPDKTGVDSKTASLSIGCSSEHARYSRSKEWCSQSRKQAQHVFAPARPCQVIVTFSATYLFESFSFHIPFEMVYDSLILKQFVENKSWESST